MSAVIEKHTRSNNQPPDKQNLPLLENGDRLSRTEFEQRYTKRPDVHNAELIEGVVYVASPVCVFQHGEPHSHIITWLGVYAAHTPAVRIADNATLRLDLDNEPQPDAILWIDERYGGKAQVTQDDYLQGTPELVVEVAASSAAYDLHDKLHAYCRNGVQEYLVLLAHERRTFWYELEQGIYRDTSKLIIEVFCVAVYFLVYGFILTASGTMIWQGYLKYYRKVWTVLRIHSLTRIWPRAKS